jgi:RNA polymerase sigma factor (sigma-70 family)
MIKVKRRITKSYFNIARRQYAPLIQRLSTTIGVNETQIEELKNRANEELLKCMICYDRSGSFMTFLYFRLNGTFRHLRDVENRVRRIKSMSNDSIMNIAEPDHNIDCAIMVQECLECLNEEERIIITELFMNDKTMREVSGDRGVVASTICRIKTRAIGKMRQKYKVVVE